MYVRVFLKKKMLFIYTAAGLSGRTDFKVADALQVCSMYTTVYTLYIYTEYTIYILYILCIYILYTCTSDIYTSIYAVYVYTLWMH